MMQIGREELYKLLSGRGEEEVNQRVRETLRDPDSPLRGFLEEYCAVSGRALDMPVVGQLVGRGPHQGPGQERPGAGEDIVAEGGPVVGGRRVAVRRGYRLAVQALLALLVIGMLGAGGAAIAWKSRLDHLEEEIKSLGLSAPIRFDEPKVFANEGRDRVSVSGSANASYIRRVHVTWAEGQRPVTIYEGPSSPEPDGLQRRFSARSPAFELDYRIVTPNLRIEPYVGIETKLPQFFEQKSYSRSFLLSVDGIIPDPDVATALAPVWLKVPSRPIRLRANDSGYEFGGVSRRDGWAVVLIREDHASRPWYVQNFGQPIRVEPGKPFTVPCTLAPGIEHFEIKAVLLRSLEESPFTGRKEFHAIPSSDTRDERLESIDAIKFSVTRGGSTPADVPGEKAESAATVEVLLPLPESTVARVEVLEGRTKSPGYPVVLVMPDAAGQSWIVQPHVASVGEDGAFSTKVYCGDSSTRPMTRFRIIVVLAKDKMTAESYTEGMKIRTLPLDLPHSKPLTVKR